MNRTFLGLFVLLAMLLPCLAYGAGSPVVVTHTLTGYSKGADAVTLEYSLHVVNQGKDTLSDLTLGSCPLPSFRTRPDDRHCRHSRSTRKCRCAGADGIAGNAG